MMCKIFQANMFSL